jgi:hypothetical protein
MEPETNAWFKRGRPGRAFATVDGQHGGVSACDPVCSLQQVFSPIGMFSDPRFVIFYLLIRKEGHEGYAAVKTAGCAGLSPQIFMHARCHQRYVNNCCEKTAHKGLNYCKKRSFSRVSGCHKGT